MASGLSNSAAAMYTITIVTIATSIATDGATKPNHLPNGVNGNAIAISNASIDDIASVG